MTTIEGLQIADLVYVRGQFSGAPGRVLRVDSTRERGIFTFWEDRTALDKYSPGSKIRTRLVLHGRVFLCWMQPADLVKVYAAGRRKRMHSP